MDKILSNINSTTRLLLANATYTGTVENVVKYESVTITIKSNVSSTTDGIILYLGSSLNSLIAKYTYTYTANENKTITVKLSDTFFRLEYNNNNISQSSFSIQTFYSYVLPQSNVTITEPLGVKLSDAAGTGITSTNTALNVNIQSGNLNVFDNKQFDLFGNIKVSSSFTLLDIDHVYNKNSLSMDEYVSGGTSVYQTNNASVLMSVSENTNRVIRQSRLYTAYQPGKSLCIRMTGVLNANSNANTTSSRIGYFDESNGLFFQYSGGIYSIVQRKKNADNTVTDTVINRNNWNDPLDGSGESQITVDFTKNIIYYIEFAFLGVGIVKMGVVFSGTLYIAYTFTHTTLTYPYIATPNLPMRWDISSSGGAGQLVCTCGSVQSEGGYNITGNPFGIGMITSSTPFKIDSANTTNNYIMCIRLTSLARRTVKLVSLSLICTSQGNAIYNLYKVRSPTTNPIIPNTAVDPDPPAPEFSSITNSDVQYHLNTSTGGNTPKSNYLVDLTNADLLFRNYFTENESLNLTNFAQIGGPIYLTAGINTTAFGGGYYSDYLVLTAQQISNSDETYYGSMNWIEI
jgi:hypothetical protein